MIVEFTRHEIRLKIRCPILINYLIYDFVKKNWNSFVGKQILYIVLKRSTYRFNIYTFNFRHLIVY